MAEENEDPNLEAAQEPVEPEKPKKKKAKECPACEAGAPAWMATFADMATLLMAFFVLILSFTEMEDPSITKMLEGTMTDAFGVHATNPVWKRPWAKMIATRYKTQNPSRAVEAQGRHHQRRARRAGWKKIRDVSQSETLSDIENLQTHLCHRNRPGQSIRQRGKRQNHRIRQRGCGRQYQNTERPKVTANWTQKNWKFLPK